MKSFWKAFGFFCSSIPVQATLGRAGVLGNQPIRLMLMVVMMLAVDLHSRGKKDFDQRFEIRLSVIEKWRWLASCQTGTNPHCTHCIHEERCCSSGTEVKKLNQHFCIRLSLETFSHLNLFPSLASRSSRNHSIFTWFYLGWEGLNQVYLH